MKLGKQNGVALIIVIVVMAALAILGAGILHVSIAETKQVSWDQKRMQAYYLAKSGASATAAWMLNPLNNGEVLIDAGWSNPPTALGRGEFTVSVERNQMDTSEIFIKSVGTVDNVEARAVLTLYEYGYSSTTPLFDNVIFATYDLTLTGDTTVHGNVEAGDQIITEGNSLNLDEGDQQIEGTGRTNPAPIFPTSLPYGADADAEGNLHIEQGTKSTYTINTSSRYNNLILENGTLIFNTGGSTMSILVDNLDLKNGTVKISGGGTLWLFVNSSADFITDTNYNPPPETPAEPKSLVVLLNNGCSILIPGNRVFNGFVYGPYATVNLTGTDEFTGAIIGGNVNCTGTPEITYAEDDSLEIGPGDLPIPRFVMGKWINPYS